jgi:hypothetical protein
MRQATDNYVVGQGVLEISVSCIDHFCKPYSRTKNKSKYPEKTPDLPQDSEKLNYIMLYGAHLVMTGIRTGDMGVYFNCCIDWCPVCFIFWSAFEHPRKYWSYVGTGNDYI